MSVRWLMLGFAVVSLPNRLVAQTLLDPDLQVETLPASGLEQPTAMRFAPNGDIFVAEKGTGKVRVVSGSVVTDALDLSVANNSERGLLGLELHPDFGTNGYVYLYYSAASGGDGSSWTENRLSRFTWNGSALENEESLLSIPNDPLQANGPNHNGGPILFGPDGKLYGTTGDLNRDRAEQNNTGSAETSADTGGIYRLNDDGSVPTDNPFMNETDTDVHRWFSYGLRNSFGMAFDPVTGRLWDTENGPNLFDEINLVDSGFNSGWNSIMGPAGSPPDLVVLDGSFYSDPEFSFRTPIGITSLQFLAGSSLAGYQNGVIVGDNNTQDLYLLQLNEDRDGFVLSGGLADLVADNTTERNSLLFGQDFGVVTDIRVGPDGAVYVLSLSNSAIYRITAVPEAGSIVLAGFGGIAVLAVCKHRRRTASRLR